MDYQEEKLWEAEGCLVLWGIVGPHPGPIEQGRQAGLGMEQGEQPGPSKDDQVF